jgi:DHA1 family tetracycline resistance protein-like MFS transporter
MSRPWSGVLASVRGLEFQGNVRVLAITGMNTGAYVTMLSPLLQPFVVKSLGYPVFVLGALVALGGRPLGVASSMVQPFAGRLADLFGRKPLILLGSFTGICSMLSFLLAATTHALAPLAAGFLLFGLSLVGYPAAQATIAESVSMDQRKVRVAFSVVFFFTYLPGIVAPGIGGYVAPAFGYIFLFGAAALLECANLAILVPALKETGEHGASDRPRFSLRQSLAVPRGLVRTFIPFAMDAFTFGIGGSIIYGLWSSALGLSETEIGLIASVLAASIAATQYASAKILLRFGPRYTLAFSEFLTVVVLLGWLLAPVFPVLLALAVVFGFSVSTWLPSLSSMMTTTAPAEERGSVFGKMAFFRGLAGAPAPFIGGYLFASFGYSVPVFLSLVGEAVTVVALLKLLPR